MIPRRASSARSPAESFRRNRGQLPVTVPSVRAQLEEFVAVVCEMGERAVIVVTPERIEACMGGEEPE